MRRFSSCQRKNTSPALMVDASWTRRPAWSHAPEHLRQWREQTGGAAASALVALALCAALALLSPRVRALVLFAWGCFIRPVGKTSNQAERLDRFYETQASVYDATRTRLLRGRKTMLQLCAQHLKDIRQQFPDKPLVWIDLGAGTGWNIEQMAQYIDLNALDAVYLIDLCEPLLDVARARVKARGWNNVHVLCQDAASFAFPRMGLGQKAGSKADLVTMSYSLSMIPPFYATLDRVDSVLEPDTGIIGVCDFYAAPDTKADKGRGCHPITRWFWTWWFSWDHVHLHPARRDYLEHRFGTVKCFNGRNQFLIPGLIQMYAPIPTLFMCCYSLNMRSLIHPTSSDRADRTTFGLAARASAVSPIQSKLLKLSAETGLLCLRHSPSWHGTSCKVPILQARP